MNSVSLESWVNGEYDRPFGIARLPVAWPSFIATHYPFLSEFTQSSISWLVVVVGRQWVTFWKALIVLYRYVVVWMNNIDLLPIVSTKSTPTIRIWSPKVTFQIQIRIQISNTMTIIRQPFESSFQAQSNQCINTARPPCGRPRKTHLTKISAIMISWLVEDLKKRPHEAVSSMTVGTS